MKELQKNLENYLKLIDDVIEKGHFKDNWDSLANHKVPDWYRNAKFGIFIHWGAFTVPEYGNEWYPRHMYEDKLLKNDTLQFYQHHKEAFGAHKNFGYRDLIPLFKAEKFDAAAWADLFEQAGAKFVMPVAEHHDGFPLYDCSLTEWCAAKKGPQKDIIALLKTEIEKRGLVFTASSHRVEHHWFMGTMRDVESDFPGDGNIPYGDIYWPSYEAPVDVHNVSDCGYVDPLFMQDWLARTCEIVDKYKPKIVYFDWWIQVEPMKPYLKKFMAYYYNRALEWGEEVTVNYKNDAFVHTSGVRDIERGQLSDVSPFFWQNDTSVSITSWSYVENNQYKTPVSIICDLIDVVSKNGSLLLNVGPRADGTMPEEDTKILKAIGNWLKVNGEAIYESYPFRKYGEGPTVTEEGHFTDTLRKPFTSEDFRFTVKNNNLYVIAMKWPQDGIVKVKLLGKKSRFFNAVIEKAEIFGQDKCEYIACDDHLTIIGEAKASDLPVCIKLTFN